MNSTTVVARPCTISESIVEACKEVKCMKEGTLPKRSLGELFADIEKWQTEDFQHTKYDVEE